MSMEQKTQALKKIIMECIREVFAEGMKSGTEQDIRGVLGFPFDKHIVAGTVRVDDGKDEKKSTYVYSWKILIPVDDPEIISNLDESQETFEEKLLETIAKKLRNPAPQPGGQFTTGFAEVEKRQNIRGTNFLLIKVELTVGWDV
jgi:hypothetical protein